MNGKGATQLTTYTIPTNVTKLNNHCFANCENLTEIKGLEQIKEFGKYCFDGCPKLSKKEISNYQTMQTKP